MYLLTVLLDRSLNRVLENFLVTLIRCDFFFFSSLFNRDCISSKIYKQFFKI